MKFIAYIRRQFVILLLFGTTLFVMLIIALYEREIVYMKHWPACGKHSSSPSLFPLPSQYARNTSKKNLTESVLMEPRSCTLLRQTERKRQIIIIVKSSPTNINRRNMIRTTWGSASSIKGTNFCTIFLIGSVNSRDVLLAMKEENRTHSDILQVNISDHYRNLPRKVISGLHWIVHHCKITKEHVVVTDDDCVLNMAALYEFFTRNISHSSEYQDQDNHGCTSFIHCGYMREVNAPPNRNPRSKWFIPYTIYSGSTYPEFCHGGMYILPSKLVKGILEMAMVTNFDSFPFEDVLITGILRNKLRAKTCTEFLETNGPVVFHVTGGKGRTVEYGMWRRWKIWKYELSLKYPRSRLSNVKH